MLRKKLAMRGVAFRRLLLALGRVLNGRVGEGRLLGQSVGLYTTLGVVGSQGSVLRNSHKSGLILGEGALRELLFLVAQQGALLDNDISSVCGARIPVVGRVGG